MITRRAHIVALVANPAAWMIETLPRVERELHGSDATWRLQGAAFSNVIQANSYIDAWGDVGLVVFEPGKLPDDRLREDAIALAECLRIRHNPPWVMPDRDLRWLWSVFLERGLQIEQTGPLWMAVESRRAFELGIPQVLV